MDVERSSLGSRQIPNVNVTLIIFPLAKCMVIGCWKKVTSYGPELATTAMMYIHVGSYMLLHLVCIVDECYRQIVVAIVRALRQKLRMCNGRNGLRT